MQEVFYWYFGYNNKYLSVLGTSYYLIFWTPCSLNNFKSSSFFCIIDIEIKQVSLRFSVIICLLLPNELISLIDKKQWMEIVYYIFNQTQDDIHTRKYLPKSWAKSNKFLILYPLLYFQRRFLLKFN